MQMVRHPMVNTIEPEVAATVADFDYELVQITLGGPPGRRHLTIYIDKPEGVTSKDCACMAERLSLLLETMDPVPDHGTLTVSSPGVERPLTSDEDFARFAGQRAAITSHPPGGKKATRTGVIRQVAEGQVRIDGAGHSYEIPLADIIAAHLVYDWEEEEH